MANDVKVTNISVQWCITVPQVGCSVLSPIVIFDGQQWNFRFVSSFLQSKNNVTWRVDSNKLDKHDLPAQLCIALHFRNKEGKYVYLNETIISSYDTNIWRSSQQSFLSKYSQLDRNKITFLLTFDCGFRQCDVLQRNPGKRGKTGKTGIQRKTEHKSVQTSHSYSWEELQCLQKLSFDFGTLMRRMSNCDVLLKCGSCIIPAHKIVLGARSQVFLSWSEKDSPEERVDSIEIVDIEPRFVQTFVRYLYTGYLPELSEDSAVSLFETGEKYKVPSLSNRCLQFLVKTLTPENAFRILAIAEAYRNRHFKICVISYILDEDIASKDELWPEFCNSNPKLANEILNEAYKRLVSPRGDIAK